MHICYVADARSPIAKSWISYFVEKGHRVRVISSYPCRDDEIPGATIVQYPLLWARYTSSGLNGRRPSNRRLPALPLSMTVSLRAWTAPLSSRFRSAALAKLISEIRPDLVHAMRLPYEGLFAAASVRSVPLLISIWGNDLTLFAERYPRLGKLTNAALQRADGLHCDCERDRKLAIARGFSVKKPSAVLPGNGGLDCTFYFSLRRDPSFLRKLGIPDDRRIVINPRGLRAYVRNEAFFKAIPLVAKQVPNTVFVCPGMCASFLAQRWVRNNGVSESVLLLPTLERQDLARVFAASEVVVSPSSHDGTPNSLLEAMACGCLPVVGNVDSIKEWITHEQNGLFCDESNPESIAAAVIRALKDPELRGRAALTNQCLIQVRAQRGDVMAEAEELYTSVQGCHRSWSFGQLRHTG